VKLQQFRIVCSGGHASRRLAQDGRSVAAFVVVVMEARSVPIDTPAAEYRPWRLLLWRVTHPEINASARVSRSLPLDRPGDDKREHSRECGVWCESVAKAAASPQTQRALSPP